MRYADCHPDRKHMARGWCAQCYTNAKARIGFVKTGRAAKIATCGHGGRAVGNGLCQACYSKDHRRRNPEKRAEWALRAKLAVYGLTPDDFRALMKRQENVCGLCGNPFKSSKDTQVDHCHETGRVRGILCFTCNKGLGMLGDNVAGLNRALDYLKRDPDPFWRERMERAA